MNSMTNTGPAEIWIFRVQNWMMTRKMIGSEDEENNFYSIGGDDHNDLDEDKDEL